MSIAPAMPTMATCCVPAPPGVGEAEVARPPTTTTSVATARPASRRNAASRKYTTPIRQAHAASWTGTDGADVATRIPQDGEPLSDSCAQRA
jgi:hypothetical protein